MELRDKNIAEQEKRKFNFTASFIAGADLELVVGERI